MVTDQQVRRLIQMSQESADKKTIIAMKAGMDEKTARKYLSLGRLPSEVKPEHSWQTRGNPFEAVWDEIKAKLGNGKLNSYGYGKQISHGSGKQNSHPFGK